MIRHLVIQLDYDASESQPDLTAYNVLEKINELDYKWLSVKAGTRLIAEEEYFAK